MNERLLREVLREDARRNIPASTDLWPVIRRRLRPRTLSGWRSRPLAAGGSPPRRGWLAATAVIAVLLLGATLALPVVARSILPHSVPREIAPATPGAAPILPAAAAATFAPTPTGRRWEPLEGLAETVGGTLLVPTYLPPGCAVRERFGIPAPVNAAYLTYSCVDISQQAVVRGGAARDEHPAVGAGAVQEVTVGGRPALYIRGSWVNADALTPQAVASPPPNVLKNPKQGELVWREDFGETLVLERDGLIIRLQGGTAGLLPGSTIPGRAGKDELIRIAESLQPYR